MFPVQNWSMGGVLLNADPRLFTVNQDIDFTVKFRLHNRILEIPHTGTIIRKTKNNVAIKFKPLNKMLQSTFQQAIDDYVASQFARTQAQAN
jgi:hypothetical protein